MDEDEAFIEQHKIVYIDGFLDVAYFRFTPSGLSTRWYSELSRWTNPIRDSIRDAELLELPTTNEEVLDALFLRVCKFNKDLLAGFRAKPSERKLVLHAFQPTVSPSAPVAWSHGILTAVVLDRLMWACNKAPVTRPPQVPFRAQAQLKADASRMRKLYDDWPKTASEFIAQWQTSRTLAASASDAEDLGDVVASLVRGIDDTGARARTSVVENNFCYAALGILCLTLMGDKEMKSTALGAFISQKTGIQSDVLQNAKAYQLLRTAYIMTVFSPVCLLGQYILTNTGKTRIHMYSVVDALSYPALEDDAILNRIEFDILKIVLKMVTHGRGIYHRAMNAAVKRWVDLGCGECNFDIRPATKKVEWKMRLEQSHVEHPLSQKMYDILFILSSYKGRVSACPIDTKEDQFLLKVAQDHENILDRFDLSHDDDDEGDDTQLSGSDADPGPPNEQSPPSEPRQQTPPEADAHPRSDRIEWESSNPRPRGGGQLADDEIESDPVLPVQHRSQIPGSDEIEWERTKPTEPQSSVPASSAKALRERNLNIPHIGRSGPCAKEDTSGRRPNKRRRVAGDGTPVKKKKANRAVNEAQPRRSIAYDYPEIERDPANDPLCSRNGVRVRMFSPYKYTRDKVSRSAVRFTDGLEKWNKSDTYVRKWPAMRETAKLFKIVMDNCVEPSIEGKIRTVSRAFWDKFGLQDRRNAFKECNVFVADRDQVVFLPVTSWTDTDGIRSLLSTLDERAVDDMSCPIDVRGRRASLDSFFAIRQDVTAPHALLFYEEDMFPDYFAADIRSFDDASPFIADQSEDYTWLTDLHPVDFGARWVTFASADVMVSPHLSSAGLCTVVRVIKGNAIVYVGDATPAYARKNSRNLEGTSWQAIGLEEGDQIYLRPDTMYGTVMLEDSIIMGAHFYFSDTLNETLESLLLHHFLGQFYSGTAAKLYPKAIVALFKLIGAWAHASKPGGRPWRLPDGENIASLLLIIQHAPQLFPWMGDDDPYLNSDSFTNDWYRACHLAHCFWAGAKSPELHHALNVRYIRFNRECDHYYKEAETPSLKIRVIDLPSKFTLD